MKIVIKKGNFRYSVDLSDDTSLMDFMNNINEAAKKIYSSKEVNDYWE
jgi:hypothetical protein